MAVRGGGFGVAAILSGMGKLRWLLAVILVLLISIAVTASVLLVDRQAALQRASRYNLSWLFSQASNEVLRFLEVISASAIPGSTVDRDEVDLRFDIVQNRVQLMSAGEAEDFIGGDPESVATVAQLRKAVTAVGPLLDKLPDPKVALQIRGFLEPMVAPVNQLAAAANQRGGVLVDEDQRRLSQLHWSLTGLTFGMMAIAVAMLGWIVFVRTRLLEEVVAAKHAAEAANAAKSQFLANMSHELRTPMNGILGMVELAIDSPSGPEQQGFLKIAHQSGMFLLDLISGILDFARIESGRIVLDEQPFDPRVLIEDVVALLGAQAKSKRIDLRAAFPPDLPSRFIGDPVRLRQVVTNLLGNAIKFTENGEVLVTVQQVVTGAHPTMLRVAVRDTGIGIAKSKLDRIFEPFIQADASTTRRFGGTGLGLTIAQQIVAAMGGEIGVESQEGEGSTFWFTVRLAPDPALSPHG